MKLARIVLICAAFALTQFVPAAQAQRPNQARTDSELRAVAQFRPRPAADRLATARRLVDSNVMAEFFDTPFNLTPNQPRATGRGHLRARFASVHPLSGSAGLFSFLPTTGFDIPAAYEPNRDLTINLDNAAGKRFLVDCTVAKTHSAPVQATTATISIQVNNDPGELSLLSFVTAPGEDEVNIFSDGLWTFWGCEVTRIQ